MRKSTLLFALSTSIVVALLVLVHSSVFAFDPSSTEMVVVESSYPADPNADTPWTGTGETVSVLEAQFNRARSIENTQLGAVVKPLKFPSQAEWDAKDDGQKMLWLINKERTDRQLAPLAAVEKNVTQVASSYASWLLANNAWGHNADGRTPYERLNAKNAIADCHDFLGVSENLYVTFSTYDTPNRIAIERAVYSWMYDDSTSDWGHRHALLWTPYTDNSGTAGVEGFIGVGHARGAYTCPSDPSKFRWPNADMIVLNLFDPCATWQYAAPPTITPPPAPKPAPAPIPIPNTAKVSGQVHGPTWVTIEQQPFEYDPKTFPGKWEVSDSDGTKNGEYYWALDNCHLEADGGGSNGMAVGGGENGEQFTSCKDRYPDNVRSWMIYGPFSLADAIQAEMRVKVWVYTEPYKDELCLLASVDKKSFHGSCVSGSSTTTANPYGWVEELLDLNRVYYLGSLLGKSNVYVALAFVSNETLNREYLGAFADNLVLRKGVIASGAEASDSADSDSAAPLAGVRISDENGNWVLTDATGAFTLPNLSKGRHLLTASKDGHTFYPSSMTVDLTNGDVSSASFVGSASVRNMLYVPGVRYQTHAQLASVPLVKTDESFEFTCTVGGCSLEGPLTTED